MLCVLKRTVSMRRSFGAPKTNVNIGGEEIILRFMLENCLSQALTAYLCSPIGTSVIQCKDTVIPTKSDSDVILCLQLLSKTRTCTLRLG